MKALVRLALILGLGTMLASCAPVVEAHYVLSFEGVAGIQVTERRRLPQDNYILNWAVPVRYVLKRDGYALHFSMSDIASASHIIVTAKSRDGKPLRIVPRPDRKSYTPTGAICASHIFEKPGRDVMFFSWPEECSHHKDRMQLAFALKDADGNTVGDEILPFEMKWDGFIYYIDSL